MEKVFKILHFENVLFWEVYIFYYVLVGRYLLFQKLVKINREYRRGVGESGVRERKVGERKRGVGDRGGRERDNLVYSSSRGNTTKMKPPSIWTSSVGFERIHL